MPKVLVTGVAGFLGARLAKRLLKEGWEVAGVDLVPPGSTHRLEGLKVDYRWMSLQDIRVLDAPYVVHAAAVADVPLALASPNYALQQNVMGTAMLLEAAARHNGFEHLVVQSSESVYGFAKKIPITEEEGLNPSNVYGASKASQELIARAYHNSHHLPVTIIRSSTLFGPEMRRTQAVTIFLTQAMKGEPITLHGDGQQSRDLNFVDNCVDGIVRALANPDAVGDIFNVASGRETTMKQLAEMCIAIVGEIPDSARRLRHYTSESTIIHTPQRPGEQGIRLVLDISKAQRVLGYQPTITLEQGLKETSNWLWEEDNPWPG